MIILYLNIFIGGSISAEHGIGYLKRDYLGLNQNANVI